MNRLFLEPQELKGYGLKACGRDWERAQVLMSLLKDVDYMLDIHSTSASCEPFAFSETVTEERLNLLAGFPIDRVYYNHRSSLPGTTMDWIERCGGVGFTVECGEHRHAAARGAKIALASSLALLRNLHMLGSASPREQIPTQFTRIVHRGLIRDPASLSYEPFFKSDCRVEFGQVLGRDKTGIYRAPTKKQVASIMAGHPLPNALTAIMVTSPSRVAKVRPHDAFLLGVEDVLSFDVR